MGKHAAPRKPLFSRPAAQRATAVSLGSFVLCLGAAAPAFATTGTPTPPPVPKPLADVVQQISDTAGVPNPIGESTPPKHHRTGKHTSKPKAPASHTTTDSRTGKPATHTAVAAYTPNLLALAALHNPAATRAAELTGQEPSMAAPGTVQRIAPAAAHRSLINLPGTPAQQDTERILLVAAATLLLGGLASGHLKAAQRRMIAW